MNEEQYVDALDKKVKEKLKVDQLQGHPDWEVFRDILQEEIGRMVEDVLGDKYTSNREAELVTKGEIKMARRLFSLLGAKQKVGDAAQVQLDQFNKDKKNEV